MTAHSFLGAYLAVTGSPKKACWSPGQILVLHAPAGVRVAMNRRPAGRTSVPRAASVTHWDQAGWTSPPSAHRRPGACPGPAQRGCIPGLRGQVKKFPGKIRCHLVLASDGQGWWVMACIGWSAFNEVHVGARRFAAWPQIASFRSCVPQDQRRRGKDGEVWMRSRPATLTAPARPASPGPPPAAPDQHDEPCDRGGHPAAGPEAGLDAYIAQLVDQAPPLSSEQRDTLALILRRPRRTPSQATPDTVPQRASPFHG
jgi:hypothetical protein